MNLIERDNTLVILADGRRFTFWTWIRGVVLELPVRWPAGSRQWRRFRFAPEGPWAANPDVWVYRQVGRRPLIVPTFWTEIL